MIANIYTEWKVSMTERDPLEVSGIRPTSARLKILRLLEQSKQHLRAEDIHKQLQAAGNNIGVATIYRTLTQFENAGIVERHNFDDEHAVYELNTGEHHDHMVCTGCSAVVEFVDPKIEERQIAIAKQYNFQMTDHQLTIYGKCPKCKSI